MTEGRERGREGGREGGGGDGSFLSAVRNRPNLAEASVGAQNAGKKVSGEGGGRSVGRTNRAVKIF